MRKIDIFSSGIYIVENEKGLLGLETIDGHLILECKCRYIGRLKNSVSVFVMKRKYGVLNEKGEIIVPAIYTDIFPFIDKIACVKIKDKYGYIDTSGKNITDVIFDAASLKFTNGFAAVCIDNNWSFIDKSGSIICDFIYDEVEDFTSFGYAVVKKEGKCGVIDTLGKEVIPCIYNSVKIAKVEGKVKVYGNKVEEITLKQ